MWEPQVHAVKVKLPSRICVRMLEDHNEIQPAGLGYKYLQWFICFLNGNLGLMSLLTITSQYIFLFFSILKCVCEVDANIGKLII